MTEIEFFTQITFDNTDDTNKHNTPITSIEDLFLEIIQKYNYYTLRILSSFLCNVYNNKSNNKFIPLNNIEKNLYDIINTYNFYTIDEIILFLVDAYYKIYNIDDLSLSFQSIKI